MRNSPLGGAGGRLDFDNYLFSEGHHPHCFITKLAPFGVLSTAEQNKTLSREKSLINSNEAYKLATNWLALIDVDVNKLEKSNKCEVRQRWCYGENWAKVLLPIFYVRWGEWDDAKADVCVDGRNRELLEFRIMNQAGFSRRPTELVKDLEKLFAIPDEEFKAYSPTEKSNLVARFAVNWPITNQATVLPTTNALPQR